ncbi:hypothetical protein K9M79_02405 [Candidatus Woesearchaeota archaeon]|nr:hypothetical protein [Candidatus Woesearchaeota archaeon]
MPRKNEFGIQGQIQGQPLIYMLSVIIMALILIYGYNAVNELLEKQEFVSILKFETYIQSEFEKISRQYGSTKIINLNVPAGYNEICFIDLSAPVNPALSAGSSDAHPIIHQSWELGNQKNIFLVKKITEKLISAGTIKIESPYYFCLDTSNGMARIKITGGGDHTIVAPG